MRGLGKYILNDDGQAVPCDNSMAWALWYESAQTERTRQLALTRIDNHTFVSTVFIGIDHNWSSSGDPVLWETMIFGDGGESNGYQRRYSSREAALTGHREACDLFGNPSRYWRIQRPRWRAIRRRVRK
jgi:hypothetical protein